MFAKSVIALAAVASFAVAAPVEQRGAPAGWAYGYLEDYDTYHVRYLALKCQNFHKTQFFNDCCRPMLSTENLQDNRKAECRPSQEATDRVVASLAAKNSAAPSTAAPAAASASASEDCDDDWSASAQAAPSSDAPSAAAPSAAATTSAAAVGGDKYIADAPSSAATTSAAAWSEAPKATQAPTTTAAPTTQAPAATQAPATQAPAAQQQSSSNNGGSHSGGYATYFYQGGNAGACGTVHGDYDQIAAIDHEQWGDQSFGSGSNTCGRWLTVCNTNNGKCTSVMVADVCPTCANGNSLDLSVGAFKAIANEQDGMVPITWSWN